MLELGGKLYEKEIRDIAGGGLRGLSSTFVTSQRGAAPLSQM